jgi:ribulose-5-phosphate 4-epimerase/fuculose-1-phosphate aldolase
MSLDSRLVNLAATAHKLVASGFVRGTAGSVSLRWEDQCYISPAGARLDRLSAADFIPLSVGGNNTWQLRRASAEYGLHLACYRTRPDLQTVLRIQPPHCMALGCAGLSLRALSPSFVEAVGAEIPLLPYRAPASQALIDAVAEAIVHHDALLLRNQGLVVAAAGSDEAWLRSQLIEEAAQVVLLAHAAAGGCSFLTADQIEELSHDGGRP